MKRDIATEMRVLANDLDSAFLRIESMPPHENLTNAGAMLQEAKRLLEDCQSEVYQKANQ